MSDASNSFPDIEFPPFESFQIDTIKHFRVNTAHFQDLYLDDYDYNQQINMVEDILTKQIENDTLIYFPKDEFNVLSFSPKSQEIYQLVKSFVDDFSNKTTEEILNFQKHQEIASKWHQSNNIIKNISYIFGCFVKDQESYQSLFYSNFEKNIESKKELIQFLHQSIVDSFNNERIPWFTIDCSDILITCNVFDINFIIPQIKLSFNTLQEIHNFVQMSHSLIPSQYEHHIYNFLNQKISDFSVFFNEVPQNWKYISSLFEIYEANENVKDFITKFTVLVKSRFSLYNPFQIFDEIHSLVTTNFMFVIRNIISTLFSRENELCSILLANYIHVTFMSLKHPIDDERLFLFDEICQQSNGLFIRYHCHNLLKRLLLYKSLTFDADERFANICKRKHMTTIINDFKKNQQIIQSFNNPSSILTFSLFHYEFFVSSPETTLFFPKEFEPIVQSFEKFILTPGKSTKWNFHLSQVTLKAINIIDLNIVKCDAVVASILLSLSKNGPSTQEEIMKDIGITANDLNEKFESLKAFSLIEYNQNKYSINQTPTSINKQINIPFIPKISNVDQKSVVQSIQLEAAIVRYVKIHPNQLKETVYQHLKSLFVQYEFTEKEFIDSIGNLIKKQILSPLECFQTLNLTYP
ncbi:hypothetical protein TRFO_07456 [Tritrichomonas foetus]|uniref:Cullin family profile domain-containing protein n=1 Tax=Tritrichomonas foetus TaxID=1144522 RepID=A0A1J4JR37_9EUKA|nr:hypothetical protein TRFO_07456 [Tritrichomonas foetus]|eukprot:OHT01577.1 hypothetical protein TRFO_07456 [Tritrichomonas foetus]